MILQVLEEYYRRLAGDDDVAPEGFTKKEIPFLIVLDTMGRFLSLQDTRSPSGKKLIGRSFLVPQERGRSGSNAWQISNLLWDHYGYVVAHPKSADPKHVELARKQHTSFVAEVRQLNEKYPDDQEIASVYRFLVDAEFSRVFSHPSWADCTKIPGCNLTFVVDGFSRPVCGNESVRHYITNGGLGGEKGNSDEGEGENEDIPDMEGMCLVTGNFGRISRIHPRTPVPGSKSNAKLVSFQKGMGFDSYGKQQGYNAPIGCSTSFAFSTVLSRMLARDSRQKIIVGDATAVFWAAKKSIVEDLFADLFGEPAKENPVQIINAVRTLYSAPVVGTPPLDEDYTPFYVLGLSPNAARLSVRFWHPGTVGETVRNIKMHFNDCRIDRGPKQPEYLSLFRLLSSVAAQGKSENIPHNLAGEYMKSILSGTFYPRIALSAAITRCRAEREVPYARASLVKALLSRCSRLKNPDAKEVGMSLDDGFTSPGYLLGRLFAVLEKVQEEANLGINATIRDRFYGSASGTPVVAFHHLMKLKNHHLAKLENRGRAVNMERLIGAIVDNLSAKNPFPAHLPLEEQGRFAVGYYHQRQAFFTKSEKSESINE